MWNANHGSFWQDVLFFFLVYEIYSFMRINVNVIKTVLNIKDLLVGGLFYRPSWERVIQTNTSTLQMKGALTGAVCFWRCSISLTMACEFTSSFFSWISGNWFIDWLNRDFLTSYRQYFRLITAVSELNHVIIVFNPKYSRKFNEKI